MDNRAIKRDSLSKQVSDKLESMIESGEYPVGERIPTEPELMDIFKVSRNTIREAVQSLTWVGILEIKQGDGTYVRASNRFRANMKHKYSQVSVQDIREARNTIEVTIAHLAAERRNDEDIKLMSEALAKRENLSTDTKENTKADLEFHLAVARACHNQILMDLYQSIADYIETHIIERRNDSQYTIFEIDEFHEQLYQAIIDKNPDAASKSVQRILNI